MLQIDSIPPRLGAALDSAQAGALPRGTVIDVLESRTLDSGQVRLRFAGGWTSLTARSGARLVGRIRDSGADSDDGGDNVGGHTGRPVRANAAASTSTNDEAPPAVAMGLLQQLAANPIVQSLIPAAIAMLCVGLFGAYYNTFIRLPAGLRDGAEYAALGGEKRHGNPEVRISCYSRGSAVSAAAHFDCLLHPLMSTGGCRLLLLLL